MHCTKCGAELAAGTKFCVTCGAPVEVAAPVAQPVPVAPAAPVEQVAPEKKEGFKIDVNAVKEQLITTLEPVTNFLKPILAKKKVKIGIIAGLAVILIASILCAIFLGGNGYVELKQQIMLRAENGEITVVVGKTVLKDKIDADDYDDYDSSIDGKISVILTSDDQLYAVNGTKLQKVADDVLKYELSVTGNGVAYLTEEGDDGYTLYLYNISSKKTTTISDEVSMRTVAISPDGKSVAYYEENDEGEDVLMYSTGKDPVKVTNSEVTLYGIANSGKYIYASRINDQDEEHLYSFNTKGESTKLGAIDSSSIRFNKDHTQVMFFNDSKTYIATNGKEATKAASGRLTLIVAPNAASFYDSNATTYPVSSLFDHVYSVTDNDTTSVWMIKKNADKSVKLVSKASSIRLDESAEYLYYIYNNDELRVVKISDGEKASDKYTKLAEDVEGYLVTSDRKYVYYVSDDSIYSVNGKNGGRSTTVCADGAESWAMNGKDVLYYVVDDALYATSNGKKGSKVLGDISYVTNNRIGIVYASNSDAVYVSDGAKKPSKLMDLD